MYYKIIICKNQLSLKRLSKILQSISTMYIIISLYNNIQYYIIYLSINNITDLSQLYKYECKIIKSTKILHYIIYKVFLLTNKAHKKNIPGLFTDKSLYNINKIKYSHNLSLESYIKIFNLNNKLYFIFYNYLNYYNYKILWLYHHNIYYLNFLQNSIYNYKKYKTIILDMNIILQTRKKNNDNIITNIKDQLVNICNSEYKYKYIILNLYNLLIKLSIEELYDIIQLLISYSYNYIKEYNIRSLIKYNIVILSYDINLSLLYKYQQYDKYITFNTFNNINN